VEPQISKVLKIQRLQTRGEVIVAEEVIWNSLHGILDGTDHGEEKKLEKRFVESIDVTGINCLDLGFNYGWWTWLLLKNIGKEGKVYAWEPNQFLYENYLSKWPFKNLTGYNYALSDRKGEQDFHIYSDRGQGSGLNSLEKIGDAEPTTIKKIKTKTLDDWWKENNQPDIGFMKIDCEGHDLKILQGGDQMIRTTRPGYIVIEQQDNDVTKILENLNYTDHHEHSDIGLADSIWKYNIQSNKGGKQ
tara:strand:- start:303 stop:1040 length:738 start_codon:yes stop_codon:yes gene_type:complete